MTFAVLSIISRLVDEIMSIPIFQYTDHKRLGHHEISGSNNFTHNAFILQSVLQV